MTRRATLQAAAWTAVSYSRVSGANDRLGMGVIGAGGRGQYVMGLFQKTGRAEIRAVCHVWGDRVDEALKKRRVRGASPTTGDCSRNAGSTRC